MNRLPASLLVSGIASIAEAAEVKPLSAVEKSEGTTAFSALLYEYGGNISAAVLVMMWGIAVIVPRVVEYLKKQNEKKKVLSLPELLKQQEELTATIAHLQKAA